MEKDLTKAIISNRIYLGGLTPEQEKNIKELLTYRLVSSGMTRLPNGKTQPTQKIEYLKAYKNLPRGVLSIPQARSDLIPSAYEIVDKRVTNEVPFPLPKIQLRPGSQQEIYDSVEDSSLINAKVGFGKTFLALHIARKLGQKTLVICHTTALRDQWAQECEAIYGMPPGIIGSGKYDIEDHFLVVSNVQSLKKHINLISKEFGTLIVDECLDYETLIDTKELGRVKIGVIVNSKKEVSVLSYNASTKTSEYKPIKQWFKTKELHGIKINHSGGSSLKCTENHSVYVLIDNVPTQVPAKYIEPGDLVIQHKLGHKSTNILNKEWLPIVLGMTLGDGSLQYPHKNSDSLRLSVTHGEAQKEYLEWKAGILKEVEILFGVTKSGYTGKPVYNFTTPSFHDSYGLYPSLYVNRKKKIITKEIAEYLTEQSWALMFQDDGQASASSSTIVFSFCELDEISIKYLQGSLTKLFNITDSVFFTCSKGYNYLRLNAESTGKFLARIANLVHPSMYYKLAKYISVSKITPNFEFMLPEVPVFNQAYATRKVIQIEPCILTNGYKYNIEVEDNHNYFANGLLVSNCHHTPATTFTELVDSFYARYRIGLSGTMERKDGKHALLTDFFSSTIYKPPQDNTLTPVVKIVKPGVFLDPKLQWSQKINKLLYDEDYQHFIANLAQLLINRGHCVLIIASRVEFLKAVNDLLGTQSLLVTGETSLEERQRTQEAINSSTAQAICGSRQIFSEGISVNRLSAVVLAEPMSYAGLLEQIVGRIQRKHDDKLHPEVYDINFSDFASRKQNQDRLTFYLNQGWEVEQYQ